MSASPFETYRAHSARLLNVAREVLKEPEQDAPRMAIADARRRGVPLSMASPGLLPRALNEGERIMGQLAEADRELEPPDVRQLERLVETTLPNL